MTELPDHVAAEAERLALGAMSVEERATAALAGFLLPVVDEGELRWIAERCHRHSDPALTRVAEIVEAELARRVDGSSGPIRA